MAEVRNFGALRITRDNCFPVMHVGEHDAKVRAAGTFGLADTMTVSCKNNLLMPITALPPVRRIVTANDAHGRSYIAEDGPAPAMRTMEGREGYRSNNLWRTVGGPTQLTAPDSSLEQRGLLPPEGGTVLRVVDIPPEPTDPQELSRQTKAVFAAMFADAERNSADARHPGMHVTATIDYAIVLQGELVAIMDEGETLMRAGDVLIQRGTNHAWANRSASVARIAFILIDARSQAGA